MKENLLILLFLFALQSSKAQESPFQTTEIQVAYFGEFLTHPGMKLGISKPIASWKKEKTRKPKYRDKYTLIKHRSLRLGSNIGFYHQVKDHNGFFFNTELTYRNTKTRSIRKNRFYFFEIAIGAGVLHYQLIGTTFQPTEDGSFQKIKGNGNTFMPSLSLAWGTNLKWIKKMDVRYFVKPAIFFEIPFGTGVLPHLVFETGVAIPFNSFTQLKKSRN